MMFRFHRVSDHPVFPWGFDSQRLCMGFQLAAGVHGISARSGIAWDFRLSSAACIRFRLAGRCIRVSGFGRRALKFDFRQILFREIDGRPNPTSQNRKKVCCYPPPCRHRPFLGLRAPFLTFLESGAVRVTKLNERRLKRPLRSCEGYLPFQGQPRPR